MGTKNYSSYSDLITFSRASSGTALAKISYGAELVTNGTFDTDSDWFKESGWTISGGTAVGTSVPAFNNFYQGSLDLVAGKVYQISASIVASSGGVQIYLGTNGNSSALVYNGDGSKELNVFFTYAAGQNNTFIFRARSTGFTGTIDNVSIKEVLYDQPDGTLQLFNHPANQPRVEYDAQGNRLGLLVEEARTNLITYSEDISHATGQWAIGGGGATLTGDAATAPSGETQAVKLDETTVTAEFFVYTNPFSQASGDITVSCYVKAAERNYASVQCYVDSGTRHSILVDLTNGAIVDTNSSGTPTIVSTGVEDVGNGWYRAHVSLSHTAGLVAIVIAPSDTANPSYTASSPTYSGVAGNGIYIWGAQLEAGSFPTSYIPTAGSTVTRAADVASIGVGAFGYNQTKNTIIVEASLFDSGWNPVVSRMISTTRYNEIRRDANALADFTGLGITAVDSWPNDVIVKVGAASKPNDSSLVINGGTLRTSASGTLQYGIDTLKFGQNNTTEFTCMHLKSIAYYPRRLTDAQIKALTSPPETPTLSLTFDDSSTSYLETSIHG